MLISGSVCLIATIILLLLGAITDGTRYFGIAIIIFSCISLSSAFVYSTLCFNQLLKEI